MSWLTRLLNPPSRPTTSTAQVIFTNTLSGKKEVFSPQRTGQVLMYSCGPTVYGKQHLGNLRAAVFSDLIARTLLAAGYRLHKVVNITDVGHLVSDADDGEDKMTKGLKREGLELSLANMRALAERYTAIYLDDIRTLGIDTDAIKFPRASDHIGAQVDMVKALEAKGYAYATSDGIYFDTSRFDGYGKLGQLAHAHQKEEALAGIGRRISDNKEKRHAADFALWKLDAKLGWPSPWGMGFPGWHLECSAMARVLLGVTLDIHTGGIDHIPVHHNNEIAQSESLSGKPLARYWLHNAFLNVGAEKIGKSKGNDLYLSDITDRGYHPLALRYYFLQAHYRSAQDFTWEALAAASEALTRLWRLAREAKEDSKGRSLPSEASHRMVALLRDDLSTPAALALLWEAIRDEDLDPEHVWGVIECAEPILGLDLLSPPRLATAPIPGDIQELARRRDEARQARDFALADDIRIHIEEGGYRVEDGMDGTIVTRRPG